MYLLHISARRGNTPLAQRVQHLARGVCWASFCIVFEEPKRCFCGGPKKHVSWSVHCYFKCFFVNSLPGPASACEATKKPSSLHTRTASTSNDTEIFACIQLAPRGCSRAARAKTHRKLRFPFLTSANGLCEADRPQLRSWCSRVWQLCDSPHQTPRHSLSAHMWTRSEAKKCIPTLVKQPPSERTTDILQEAQPLREYPQRTRTGID